MPSLYLHRFSFAFTVVTFLSLSLPFRLSAQYSSFNFTEATVDSIQAAFRSRSLTSAQLVRYYLSVIQNLNPHLRAVIEVNPDAVTQAAKADLERERHPNNRNRLHGIPILLKDIIGTADKLNTTAGSFALLGSVVSRDSGVVRRLRKVGAVILGKASMSEWAHFRSETAPNGWCARSGQGINPYVASATPCGSSSGSAIATAANLVTVTLGTETDGSILCPAAANSVVGIKPTVGLTSRSMVIPISPRQDTIGPICRTVRDAVYVLDAIVGYDVYDSKATKEAAKYIPKGGYRRFLNFDGLRSKRIGILREGFFNFSKNSVQAKVFEQHFSLMRKNGAMLIDNLQIVNTSVILDYNQSGEELATVAEFKVALNNYLSQLTSSPVRSLSDVISFNEKHKKEEKIQEYGQLIFLASESTNGINSKVRNAISNMARLSSKGIETLMKEKQLDAIVTPDATVSSILGIGGYPGISVPAGYDKKGVPFGITFGGLKGYEPRLIEIAYAFEQATKVRKPPSFKGQFQIISDL
ncbi:Glutamyl-tRNA(Gln) amidotransferase subunit A [Rhynchospora pubera]|uniref:Glutamyl-tRNA(Gln) amidotransferase subunit A n=1 Tax=Rhynchospora pubera TaxID=906938 RepID=A0AAV8F4M0_9POAL|nr:Glutamyl-tRNA(Gln) amidotransferase subunit A [Rhynchospora pubera]